MANKCIFCNTENNLSASMQVKTAHGVTVAHICSIHEDNASPKKVRELVDQKEQVLIELEQKAKELGYRLVPLNGSPDRISVSNETINHDTQTPQNIVVPRKHQKIKTPTPRPIVTPGLEGNIPGVGTIESHNSYQVPQTEAPQIITHEEQVITGRAGAPVAIPKKIVSEAGTTEVAVIDTGGEQALQQRFKDLSKSSQIGGGPDFRSGYSAEAAAVKRTCTFCRGTGIANINKKPCPKCKGVGTF